MTPDNAIWWLRLKAKQKQKEEAPIFQGGTLPVTDITAEPIGKGKYLAEFDKQNPRQEYKETNEYIRRFQPEKVVQKQAWRDVERNRLRDNYAESYMIRDRDLKMEQDYERDKDKLPWWQKRTYGVKTNLQQKEQLLNQQARARLEWTNKPLEHKAGLIASETAWALLPELFFLKGTRQGFQAAKNMSNAVSDIPTSSIINKTDDVVRPIASKVDDIGKGLTQAPKPAWQMEELPGLHLKSTMEGEAVSKIVEPKTGLINTEQALAIIAKESGGADNVAIIRQGLGNNIPKKMDFNEFRKITQEQLIPLERKFSTRASSYGLDGIGYNTTTMNFNTGVKKVTNTPLENQTLILGNKGKFGRGSSAHGNPEETLGHVHFLRDAETPDVLTVTQIQSDAFQGTHRIMPKTFDKESQLRSLAGMEDIAKRQKAELSKAVKRSDGYWELPDGTLMDNNVYKEGWTMQGEFNAMKKAEIENFTQKQLLDKNHQERYLQELVDYAGKRGDINKVRVPTSETAAKVQGYTKIRINTNPDFVNPLPKDATEAQRKAFNQYVDDIRNNRSVDYIKEDYTDESKTILKKYSEQPKTIKKLFGIEPKVVTDSKGNTWYEFDIPKSFQSKKGEIKAFSTVGAVAGTTGAKVYKRKNENQ